MSLVKMIDGTYSDIYALKDVIGYCIDIDKCKNFDGLGICLYNVDSIIDSMKVIKNIYNKTDGKQLYHLMVSICRDYYDDDFYEKNHKGDMERVSAQLVANDLCERIYNSGFQNTYSIHNDSTCYHIHFVINSVSYINGNRLTNLFSFKSNLEIYLKNNYSYLKWLENGNY